MSDFGIARPGLYRLTRNFAIGAALIMIVMAFMVTRGHDAELRRQLTDVAAEANADFTRTFVNTLWRAHRAHVVNAAAMGPDAVRAHPATAALAADVVRHARGLAVLKVKFYDARGFTAFSTDPGQIGGDYSANPRFLGALRGNDTAELEFRRSFGAIEGKLDYRWVLSSYVPIYGRATVAGTDRPAAAPGPIEGVAEVYRDVTTTVARIEESFQRDVVLTAAICAIAFLALVAFIWHADTEMRREHADNLRLTATMAGLQAKNEAKSDLLAHMSHEFRTPLNAIIGFSELIRNEVRGPIGNTDYKQYVGDICGAGRRLLGMIEDVLDLVRMERGEVKPQPTSIDPGDVVTSLVADMRPALESAHHGIEIKNPDHLTPIVTDPALVRRILTNLISNAAKFSLPGSAIVIEIEQDDRANTRIAVIDHGSGMSDDSIARARVPFGQVDHPLAKAQDGTGLGLPVSLKLAQTLGGGIDFVNRSGAGTTATLSLPARIADGGSIRTADATRPAAAPAASLRRVG